MTELEIINYLKENRDKGVAYAFMPVPVKQWCAEHKDMGTVFNVFEYGEDYGWWRKCVTITCCVNSVYCLDSDYEPKQRLKPDWEEFKIDEDGYFEFNGKKYYYREDARFEIENRDKFKGFGGWLSCDGNWRTYPALYREIDDIACYNGSCDCECEPAVPIRIRFWRR